jgi:hypothetical protein
MFTPGHARLEANRAPNGMHDCRHGDENGSGLFPWRFGSLGSLGNHYVNFGMDQLGQEARRSDLPRPTIVNPMFWPFTQRSSQPCVNG